MSQLLAELTQARKERLARMGAVSRNFVPIERVRVLPPQPPPKREPKPEPRPEPKLRSKHWFWFADEELCQRELYDITRVEPGKLKIEHIQALVASRFGMNREQMLSVRRHLGIVRPRQIAMALCKRLLPKSLPEIGRRFKRSDHTTVLHACRKIGQLCITDPVIAQDVAELEAALLPYSPFSL